MLRFYRQTVKLSCKLLSLKMYHHTQNDTP